MQKINTALLLVVIALLVLLLVRPQPGRYRSLGIEGFRTYLLDTATGALVPLQVTEEAKAKYQERQTRKNAKYEAAHQEWLAEGCPDVLASRSSKPTSPRRKECEEWQQTQHTTTE